PTISAAESRRRGVASSPSATIPTRKAPTAPMPVHTAYAVPRGSVRIETDSSPKLAIMVTMVRRAGTGRLNPSDLFMQYAQITSTFQAKRRKIHLTVPASLVVVQPVLGVSCYDEGESALPAEIWVNEGGGTIAACAPTAAPARCGRVPCRRARQGRERP